MCSRPASALARGLSGRLDSSAPLLHSCQLPWSPDLCCHGRAVWVSFPSVCLIIHLVSSTAAATVVLFLTSQVTVAALLATASSLPVLAPFSHSIPASSGPPCLCHISRRPPTGSRLATYQCLGWTSVYCSCCVALLLLLCSFFPRVAPAPPPITQRRHPGLDRSFYFPLPDPILRHLFSCHSRLHSFRSTSGSPFLGQYVACAFSCIPTSWPAVLCSCRASLLKPSSIISFTAASRIRTRFCSCILYFARIPS